MSTLINDGFKSELCVKKVGQKTWELTEPLTFNYKGRLLEVPVGFITDLASIPRILFVRYPPVGHYDDEAVLHDWAYKINFRESRKEADKLFEYALWLDPFISDRDRRNLHWSVRLGGWIPWNRYRKEEYEKKYPPA